MTGQNLYLAGHCPLTGRYLQPCIPLLLLIIQAPVAKGWITLCIRQGDCKPKLDSLIELSYSWQYWWIIASWYPSLRDSRFTKLSWSGQSNFSTISSTVINFQSRPSFKKILISNVLSHARGAWNIKKLTLLMITHISHLAYTKIWRALSFSSDFDELQHSKRNFRSSCQWLYPSSSKTIIITKLMLLIKQNTKNKFYFAMSRNVQQD